jgi:hypothetical protein
MTHLYMLTIGILVGVLLAHWRIRRVLWEERNRFRWNGDRETSLYIERLTTRVVGLPRRKESAR